MLGLKVASLLVTSLVESIEFLLMLKFQSLFDLLFHILHHELAVKFGLSHLVLIVNLDFLSIDIKLLASCGLQSLSTVIVLDHVLVPHLIELRATLLQLHV